MQEIKEMLLQTDFEQVFVYGVPQNGFVYVEETAYSNPSKDSIFFKEWAIEKIINFLIEFQAVS